ncbi:MAG: hypothetical protein AAFX56_11310 [Pseudomonadota bacterium]
MNVQKTIHALIGIAALCCALYFIVSETFVLDFSSPYLSYRTQVFTVGLFVMAALCLLRCVWRQSSVLYATAGYVLLGIGILTVWLIRYGSAI